MQNVLIKNQTVQRSLFKLILTVVSLMALASVHADLFLVKGGPGPGFTSPAQEVEVLEKAIIPTFEMIKNDKRVVVSGLPVGSRTFILIVQADTNSEVDSMLRALPAWGALAWKVVALESIDGRMATEKEVVKSLKAMLAK